MPHNQAKKPKILLLVTQADFGGAQKYAFEMAQGLRDEWHVTVGTGRPHESQELLDRAAAAGLPIKLFDHLRRAIHPWHDILAVFEVAQYLRTERPDVILANSSKAEVISALAGLMVRQPKRVATIHGFAFLEPVGLLRRIIYFKLQWLAGRLRDATVVLSEYERRIALRYSIARPDRIHVIPHGIGPMNFLDRAAARARLGLPQKKIIVGTIANLYATKGLDVLIPALKTPPLSLPRERGEILIAIIGEGPERPRLERLIREYGLGSSVNLLGSIPNASVYLKAFDLFVLPSRKEGFPYTILEAAAAGLPIVATTVGAVPEMLRDGAEARLVPPHQPKELARAISALLHDPVRAVSFGRAAEERVRTNYQQKNEIAATISVLNQAIDTSVSAHYNET